MNIDHHYFKWFVKAKRQEDYDPEAIDQSFQDFTQQFNNRLTNYEFGQLEQLWT